MQPRLIALATIGLMLASAIGAGSVQADNATAECILNDEPPEPRIGDGPWVGDAPDDVSTLLVPSCWNGQIHGPDDRDSYHFSTTQIRLWVVEGCVDVGIVGEQVYDPLDPGTGGGGEKCAPHDQRLFIRPSPGSGNQIEMAFYAHEDATADNHTGVYGFDFI